MTELQKVEYDMLKLVIDICKRLNIRYYLVCGSALGAVKYNGFIPWDDDIDIGMMRPDYEIFCKNAQSMLPNHIFLQNYLTDVYFPHNYSKLRNSNTTFIETNPANLQINNGIYIDIFPLDGYPNGKITRALFELKKKVYCYRLYADYYHPRNVIKKAIILYIKTFSRSKDKANIVRKYEKLLSSNPICDSEFICNHGNWQGKLEYAPKKQYGEGITTSFEGIDVRIPALIDEYLTQKYGNWRDELPKEEQVSHHYCEIMDVNKPYIYYTKKETDETVN